jgi:CzcA family heavy metal efflux pump
MTFVDGIRRRKAAVFLIAAILAVAGAFEAMHLPSSIFPSVTFPLVRMIAKVGEEPAAQMMPTVTRVLEQAALRVPGVHLVRSTTSRGSCELTAQFYWGTNMQEALGRMQGEAERVRPELPSGARLDIEWMNTAVSPILGYALTSDSKSQAELLALADYVLRPELIRIPGVSQVQIQGGRRRELEVHLDRPSLLGRNLSAADVINAIRADDQVLSAGFVEENHELYLSLVDGRANSVAEIERIAVPVPGGVPVRLRELGKVVTADEVSYVRSTAGGKPAVLVNIVRQPSASTVAIAQGVERLMRERTDLLPEAVTWTSFYDQAAFVSSAMTGTRDAVEIGVGLAFLVLLLFLRRWRPALAAIFTVPVTASVVGLGLAVTGMTLNLMTLAGFAAAIGLIVDDAIVVVENIHRHAEQMEEDAVAGGLRELVPALLGSSLSTTVILLPFALLGGVVGAFFKPLALTMALALALSFFLALVFVPVALGRVRPRTAVSRLGALWARSGGRVFGLLMAAVIRGYQAVGELLLRIPSLGLLSVLLCVGAAYGMYRQLGSDFLPRMDEGAIILDYSTPPGTSLDDTDAMMSHVDAAVMATPDIETYSRRTGTQLGFFITEPNRGDYVIKLKPRTMRRPIDQVIDDLRAHIARIEPALHTDFGQLLEDNIGDLTGGAAQPIDLKVFGEDEALLEQKARDVARILAQVRGVTDVFDGIVIAGPALDIRVNRDTAARADMTTADLHAELEPAISGTIVGQVRDGERMYDLRVFARPEGQSTAHEMSMLVRTPSGALLPANRLATVITGPPETEINRENLRSYVGVTARLSGRDLGSAVAEIRARLSRELVLGPRMTIRYGGLYQQQQSSFRDLLYVLFAGLALVSVVVLVEFADWRAPIVTGLIALGTLAGVFGSLWLTHVTLNISSFVAAIMMVGIAGENAIFVIHEARLELSKGTGFREAWKRASLRRLRPVAMTILATGLALAPLALGIGEGSQLVQPLAIGVIGGFVVSGPLVLLGLPAVYCLLSPEMRPHA